MYTLIKRKTMINPKIKTTVLHSYSKSAWNIVCTELGKKYKIARVPYLITGNPTTDAVAKLEAQNQAKFISECFNKSYELMPLLSNPKKQ